MTLPNDSQAQELRRRLAALRVDPPRGEFDHSLRQRLLAAGPPVAPSALARWLAALSGWRLRWPALGAAVGVAAFLLLALPPSPGERGEPVAALLPASRVAMVRLNLSADVPVDEARIHVTLPAGLAFWSDGRELAQRDFEWTQPLSTGDNEIPIAVTGHRPGRYRIAVKTLAGGQQIDDFVWIEVTGG